MTDRLSPQRETEIREHIAELIYPTYGQRDSERTLAIVEAVMPAVRAGVAAELAAVRAERDELQARSRRLIEQWYKRAETWAPLSSPEKNPETFDHYRALCSAYCETADNLHNVLNGLDPDVPWHLRKSEETTS